MLSLKALKTYNYFYFSLLSLFISFLPVYLSARGISASEIGGMVFDWWGDLPCTAGWLSCRLPASCLRPSTAIRSDRKQTRH